MERFRPFSYNSNLSERINHPEGMVFEHFGKLWILNAKCGCIYTRYCLAANSSNVDLDKTIDLCLNNPLEAERVIRRKDSIKFSSINSIESIKLYSSFKTKKTQKIVIVGREPLERFLSCFLMHGYRFQKVPVRYESIHQREIISNTLSFEQFIYMFENGFPDYYPEWFKRSVEEHSAPIYDPVFESIKKDIVYLDIGQIDSFLVELGIDKAIMKKVKKILTLINHHRTVVKKHYKSNFYCGNFPIKDLLIGNDLITKNSKHFYNRFTKTRVTKLFEKDVEFINGFEKYL